MGQRVAPARLTDQDGAARVGGDRAGMGRQGRGEKDRRAGDVGRKADAADQRGSAIGLQAGQRREPCGANHGAHAAAHRVVDGLEQGCGLGRFAHAILSGWAFHMHLAGAKFNTLAGERGGS